VIGNHMITMSITGIRYHGAPFTPFKILDALYTRYRATRVGAWLVVWTPKLEKMRAPPRR
jgi:hypothetical protein